MFYLNKVFLFIKKKVAHSLYTNVLTLLVNNKKINVLQVSLTSCIFPKKQKKTRVLKIYQHHNDQIQW